jgi:hypothetical protein
VSDRVSYYAVTVTAVNTPGATFDAATVDGSVIQGIASNPQNLPAIGQQVTVFLFGATVLYRPEGIATASVGDPQISAVGASKLSSDTITANLTLASQILTATSGQRAGITPIGLQAWDSSNALTVSLDGVNNLLTGTTQTAASGRRIVMGAAGASGRIAVIAPDGTETEVVSYAESGTESIRMGNPIEDAWAGWNAVTAQGNEIVRIASGQQVHYFGGNTTSGSKQYLIYQASNSGSPGTQPSSTERMKIDTARLTIRAPDFDTSTELTNQTWRTFLGAVSSEGSMDIIRHGVADTRLRSPRLQLRVEGGSQAMNVKAVFDSGATNPRIEITDTGDNYSQIFASAFVVSSSQQVKTDIADLPAGSLAKVRTNVRPRTFRRVNRPGEIKGTDKPIPVPGWTGPTEVGLVAEELPPELVVGEGESVGINLSALLALTVASVQELAAIVDSLRGKP